MSIWCYLSIYPPQSTTHPFIPKTFIEWLLWPKWWGYNHEKNKRWVPGFHASHSNWSIDISWRERRNSYMMQCLIAVNITKSNGVWGMVERDMELLLFFRFCAPGNSLLPIFLNPRKEYRNQNATHRWVLRRGICKCMMVSLCAIWVEIHRSRIWVFKSAEV